MKLAREYGAVAKEKKTIEMLVKEDDLLGLMEAYEVFSSSFSCRPDRDKFPLPRDGEVLDENKSVKWNREEVQRLQNAHGEEVKRLNRDRNEIHMLYVGAMSKMMGEEFGLSERESKIVWNKAWEDGHAYGLHDVYCHFEDLASMVTDLKKAMEEDRKEERARKRASRLEEEETEELDR